MSERPKVYSIAAHRGFADALVAGLVPRYSDPELGLARLTLLLPSSRAMRTMSEAFIRHYGTQEGREGLLMPRMAVVGDLDLDETLGALFDPIGEDSPIPPAADLFTQMLRIQGEAARQVMESVMPAADAEPGAAAVHEWRDSALKLQQMWLDFQQQQSLPQMPAPLFADPAQWLGVMQGWYQAMPLLDPERQAKLFADGGIAIGLDVGLAGMILLYIGGLWFAGVTPGVAIVIGAALVTALFTLSSLAATSGLAAACLTTAVAGFALFITFTFAVLMPGMRIGWPAPRIAEALAPMRRCVTGPVGVVGFREPSTTFVLGRGANTNIESIAGWMAGGDDAIAVPREHRRQLEDARARGVERVTRCGDGGCVGHQVSSAFTARPSGLSAPIDPASGSFTVGPWCWMMPSSLTAKFWKDGRSRCISPV